MPQMSPLGWAWMVLIVIFGYSIFMIFLYYVWICFLMFNEIKSFMKFNLWEW